MGDISLDLYERIMNAVSQTTPDLIDKTKDYIDNFSSRGFILERFLDSFGDNPWVAAQNAVLGLCPDKAYMEKQGVGESGQWNKELYMLTHKDNESINFISGLDPIKNILLPLNNQSVKLFLDEEHQKRVKKNKQRSAYNFLADYKLHIDKLLKNPNKLILHNHKTKDRQKLLEIIGLEEEHAKRMQELDRVIYSSIDLLNPHGKAFLLDMDQGGSFFTYLKKQNLTGILEKDLMDLSQNNVELDETSRSLKILRLFTYYAKTRKFASESLIGAYKKDIDYCMKNNIHIKLSGIESLIKSPTITMFEAQRLINETDIDSKRKEINSEYFLSFKDEVLSGIGKLTHMFKEDGKWQLANFKKSVAMNKMKKSIYYAILTRDDFSAVKDYMIRHTLSKSHVQVQKITDIESYKNLVGSITKTSRKIDYLHSLIHKNGLKITDDRQDFEKVKDLCKRNNKYDLIENLDIDLDELLLKHKEASTKFYKNHGGVLRGLLDFKLYINSHNYPKLVQEVSDVKKLDKTVVDSIKYLLKHKDICSNLGVSFKSFDSGYANSKKRSKLDELVRLSSESGDKELEDIFKLKEQLFQHEYYRCSFGSRQVNTECLSKFDYRGNVFGKKYSINLLKQILHHMQEFVQIDDISQKKLDYVVKGSKFTKGYYLFQKNLTRVNKEFIPEIELEYSKLKSTINKVSILNEKDLAKFASGELWDEYSIRINVHKFISDKFEELYPEFNHENIKETQIFSFMYNTKMTKFQAYNLFEDIIKIKKEYGSGISASIIE